MIFDPAVRVVVVKLGAIARRDVDDSTRILNHRFSALSLYCIGFDDCALRAGSGIGSLA